MGKESGEVASRGSRAEVDAFLHTLAAAPTVKAPGQGGRLMFALDATASREPSWDRACQIQGEMFQATASLGGLEIQMVFYRGFGEFRAAPWLGSSAKLVRHMTAVRCRGGQTQIGRVLRHAKSESKKKKVDALVFVGDCVEEDADRLCALAGELGLLGVPAFVFQEGYEPSAMRTFKEIARLTKGAYCQFDSASARQLRALLSAVAVYAAGGWRALEDYSKQAGADVLKIAQQVR
jgi:hypothetical protein